MSVSLLYFFVLFLLLRSASRDASLDSTLHYAIEAGIVPAQGSPQLIRRLYEIFRANYEATLNYRHEPLDRDITLLRSIEELPAVLAGPHRVVGSMFASSRNCVDLPLPSIPSKVIKVPGTMFPKNAEQRFFNLR